MQVRFHIVGGAEENNHRRHIHPQEQADGRREPTIDYAIRNVSNVQAKRRAHYPPQYGGDICAWEDPASGSPARPPETVKHGKHPERENQDGCQVQHHPKCACQLRQTQIRETQFVNEPPSDLPAEDREYYRPNPRDNGKDEEDERADLTAEKARPLLIACDDQESVHQARDHLCSSQQRSSQAKRNPAPGMPTLVNEKFINDVFAAGRQDQPEAAGKFLEFTMYESWATQNAQREEQHWEKRHEHVECDSLRLHHAVGKDARD